MKPSRIKTKVTETPDGLEVDVNCRECGKPITVSNQYGMFCENRCGIDKARKAGRQMKEFFEAMGLGEPMRNFEKRFGKI